jgi:hypothetical protein
VILIVLCDLFNRYEHAIFMRFIPIILWEKSAKMTQEKKRNYRRKPVDNLASAATEMGNIPPQVL